MTCPSLGSGLPGQSAPTDLACVAPVASRECLTAPAPGDAHGCFRDAPCTSPSGFAIPSGSAHSSQEPGALSRTTLHPPTFPTAPCLHLLYLAQGGFSLPKIIPFES